MPTQGRFDRLAFALLQPFGQHAERQRFCLGGRLFCRRTVGHDAGALRRLGDPAAVLLQLCLNAQIHTGNLMYFGLQINVPLRRRRSKTGFTRGSTPLRWFVPLIWNVA